jgi:ATP-dependent Lon protease
MPAFTVCLAAIKTVELELDIKDVQAESREVACADVRRRVEAGEIDIESFDEVHINLKIKAYTVGRW